MPRKIRELKTMLRKAGFSNRSGKGSHSVWNHPRLIYSLTLSGNDGDDARKYQETMVQQAIKDVQGGS